MAVLIQMRKSHWQEIMQIVENRLKDGGLEKPLVFALYGKEDNHYEVIDYREITTVQVKGDYAKGDYDYKYLGIKKLGFYPPKGSGKWFVGTLVVGDGIDLDEGDKRWMVREEMDFRIKMDRVPLGQWSYKAYCIDFPTTSLELQ